jgi:hypothetical protein
MATSDDKEALARRALSQMFKRRIAWMPGMALVDKHGCQWTVVEYEGRLAFTNGPRVQYMTANGVPSHADGEGIPDMDHLGTIGCIEHGMLPAAWGPDCAIEVHRTKDDHRVTVFDSTGSVWSSGWLPGSVPAKGLVLCLEAAAERRERC